jgi:predicted esterase
MTVRSSNPAALHVRPARPTSEAAPGLQSIPVAGGAEALLYVPAGYRPDTPAPLVVALHGAGGDARNGLLPLQAMADSAGIVLLSPGSAGRTWDVIVGGFGRDVARLDEALAAAFDRVATDPARLAVSGFSDGASYALSIGITNGDLFTHVIAFSPGFMAPAGQRGAPRIFIAHGTGDTVLPIDRCSRRVVPQLRGAGYDVDYREFDGGHVVPAEMARAAAEWLGR